jgi:hypothetical protein
MTGRTAQPQGHNDPNAANAANAARLSWHVRLLLGGYPPWWRLRYDDELRDTVLAIRAAGHWGARDSRDLLRGLVEAWLNPAVVPAEGPMPDPTRRLIPRTAWGLLLFVLAGGGFAKLIDDPAVTSATHHHPAIQWSLWGLMAAAGATTVLMAACTIPYLRAILSQGRRDALRTLAPLLVVPVCAVAFGVTLVGSWALADSTPLHSVRHVLAFLALVAVTLVAGISCTIAVLRVATRTPERRDVGIGRRVGMIAVGAFTTIAVVTVVGWVVAVAIEAPGLLHGSEGILATPTMPSLAAAVLGLVGAATLCAPTGIRALSSRASAPRSSS